MGKPQGHLESLSWTRQPQAPREGVAWGRDMGGSWTGCDSTPRDSYISLQPQQQSLPRSYTPDLGEVAGLRDSGAEGVPCMDNLGSRLKTHIRILSIVNTFFIKKNMLSLFRNTVFLKMLMTSSAHSRGRRSGFNQHRHAEAGKVGISVKI